MSKARLELKVGVFVAVGLVLLAAMMIQFSKGKSLLRQTYDLTLNAPDVGGLKKGASVLLSGVTVGNVRKIDLGPMGTNVFIRLEIFDEYVIHGDARFVIEQSGFLGDQYVAVVPTDNILPPLEDGDEVSCLAPFNLQEVARDAAGFLQRIDQTARDLNAAIADVRAVFLNAQTLSNLAETAASLRDVSGEARLTVEGVNALITSNRASIDVAVSNLVTFSDGLNTLADSANALIQTNEAPINASIEDIRQSTESLRKLLQKAEDGDNLAATLLTDEALAQQVSDIAYNLSITTSNLNERGLWGILWKRKPPRTERDDRSPTPLRSPGDPFR